jgi:hypothetical protein
MPRLKPDITVSKEKDKKARQANAVKQKRYRESMKAQGYRARKNKEKPLDFGWVRTAAPVIQKCSIDSTKNNPVIKEALDNIGWGFIMACEKKNISKKVWEPVYRDIQVLLKPLLEIV